MSKQPKPCPFCGWGTIVDEPFWLPNKHICKCNACGARTRICRTWEDAVKLWNMRKVADDSGPTRIKELRKEIESLCGNCDRPDKEQLGEIILSSMTFGFSVGLEAPSTDRPQGEWIHSHEGTIAEGLYCSNCGKYGFGEKFCPNCKVRMKGSDDEN